jgi:alkylhydroperoxidase family enzyme
MRVTGVFRPGDYPGQLDAETREDLEEFFGTLFPGVANPELDENHAGLAVAAHNPKLALALAQLSRLIALDLPFCRARPDLRELAIQAVNLRFGSAYSFASRKGAARAAGLAEAQLDALPAWRESPLFDEDQRLVLAYAEAVASGDAPEPLFREVATRFGERGAVELTTVAGFWGFWAMLLNATGVGEET